MSWAKGEALCTHPENFAGGNLAAASFDPLPRSYGRSQLLTLSLSPSLLRQSQNVHYNFFIFFRKEGKGGERVPIEEKRVTTVYQLFLLLRTSKDFYYFLV